MPFDSPQDPRWGSLLEAAWAAHANAHVPYSHFRVGAAVLWDGGVTAGCNVENASYPVCVCAERNAIGAAVSAGLKPGGLQALVVVTETEALTPPCGACRQVIAEFASRLPILLANRQSKRLHRIEELLPWPFNPNNLESS